MHIFRVWRSRSDLCSKWDAVVCIAKVADTLALLVEVEAPVQRNYGLVGITLIAAGMATAVPGQVIVCIGIVLLLSSGDHGSLVVTAYLLMSVGVLLLIPGSIRYVQGIYAGRRYRGDRPFMKSF